MRARRKVENIIQLLFDAHSDVGELRWSVKVVDDCKRPLEDTGDEALAAECSGKEIVRTESGFSLSGAVLNKKNVLAFLRRQITMSLSQDLFFSSRGVLKHVGHPVTALHGHGADRKVRGE